MPMRLNEIFPVLTSRNGRWKQVSHNSSDIGEAFKFDFASFRALLSGFNDVIQWARAPTMTPMRLNGNFHVRRANGGFKQMPFRGVDIG